MDERTYKVLVRVALGLTAAWIGWTVYDGYSIDRHPESQTLQAALRYLEDGQYGEAMDEYRGVLRRDSGNVAAQRGRAQALMQLGKHHEALAVFDEVIAAEPTYGVTYANRGILRDRIGDYAGALDDYLRAMELEPEVAEGPGFLTRFMRNQPQKPPTILDRANYLKEQLALPEEKRLLRVPEKDAEQRPYKM